MLSRIIASNPCFFVSLALVKAQHRFTDSSSICNTPTYASAAGEARKAKYLAFSATQEGASISILLRLLINHVTSHTTTKSFPQVNGLSRTHILDLQVLCIIQTAPQSIQMATSSCFSFI
jgi:hypothetical protein